MSEIRLMTMSMREFARDRYLAINHARGGGVVVLVDWRSGKAVCQISPVTQPILDGLADDGAILA